MGANSQRTNTNINNGGGGGANSGNSSNALAKGHQKGSSTRFPVELFCKNDQGSSINSQSKSIINNLRIKSAQNFSKQRSSGKLTHVFFCWLTLFFLFYYLCICAKSVPTSLFTLYVLVVCVSVCMCAPWAVFLYINVYHHTSSYTNYHLYPLSSYLVSVSLFLFKANAFTRTFLIDCLLVWIEDDLSCRMTTCLLYIECSTLVLVYYFWCRRSSLLWCRCWCVESLKWWWWCRHLFDCRCCLSFWFYIYKISDRIETSCWFLSCFFLFLFVALSQTNKQTNKTCTYLLCNHPHTHTHRTLWLWIVILLLLLLLRQNVVLKHSFLFTHKIPR